MQLADLRLEVRPRTAWEAMDLGMRLAQSEARLLWKTWFMVTLPVLALALLLTALLQQEAMYLLLWWLKPLYDYALLIVLSRRVFGATPSLREIARLLAGSLRQGLLGNLLWRRFSLNRAYLLPVWLLENLPARERGPRLALLRSQYSGKAQWLHIVMVHLEGFLFIAALSLLFWFAPDGAGSDLRNLFTGDNYDLLASLAEVGLYFIAMSLCEPLYVAAGFSLYLNRRTELEAWDLELAFRHLRERLDAQRRAP
jgi:hypothetical protein